MNADLNYMTSETVATSKTPQILIDEIKEESQEKEADAFDEEAEDMMLRAQLRKMIRFDGDYLQGFSDLLTDGKVNLAVDSKLEEMTKDPAQQLINKDGKQRAAVVGPKSVREASSPNAGGPKAVVYNPDMPNEIDEILILDILE